MLRSPRGGRVRWRSVPERQKRRATIRELAEYTGLSTAAVSYADRVRHALDEQPLAQRHQLVSGSTSEEGAPHSG